MEAKTKQRVPYIGRRARPKPLRLVVIERGARLPDYRGADHEHDLDVLSIGQQVAESAAAFLASAIRRVGLIERSGAFVEEAVISVGRSERGANSARALLARALLAHQGQHGGSHLELVAPMTADVDVRQELVALVGVLAGDLRTPTPSVRLRFLRSPAAPASSGKEPRGVEKPYRPGGSGGSPTKE